MSVNPYINLLSAVIQQGVQDAMSAEQKCFKKYAEGKRRKNLIRDGAIRWFANPDSTLTMYLAFFPDINPDRFREDIQTLLKNPKKFIKNVE